MPGKIRLFVVTPSSPTSPWATMGLEVNGTNVPITDGCGGFQQFLNLAAQNPSYDAEASGAACYGGPAPSGFDGCQIDLTVPVNVPPMEKGRIDIGALTLQVSHTAAYAILFDSLMMCDFDWRGGQLVLNASAANQIGVLFQPKNPLPLDTNGPCITASRVVIPSIAGVTGNNQICAEFDSTYATIGGNKEFTFTEPNGGDYGIVILGGGKGFTANRVNVNCAHGQKYGCVDVGHGHNVVGGANIFSAIVAPQSAVDGTGFDYWGINDIVDLQIVPGDTGNGWRGITLETGSSGMQCRIGVNVAATPIVMSSGSGHPNPNMINGTPYHNP